MNKNYSSDYAFRVIDYNKSSQFFLFSDTNKTRIVQNVPSEEDFIVAVNRIKSKETKLSHLSEQGNLKLEMRRTERISSRNQYINNETIRKYLTRREIIVNCYGVPMCSTEEFIVYYDLETKVPFRIIDWEDRLGWDDNQKSSHFKLVKKMNSDLELPKKYHPSNRFNYSCCRPVNEYYSPCDAFNICGISYDLVKFVLIKNKKRFDGNKSTINLSNLKGIHYCDQVFTFTKIHELSNSIKFGEIELDNIERNVFILYFHDEIGHLTCGALLVNSEDMSNPIPLELFIFDSEAEDNDNYTKVLENSNRDTGDPSIKLSHIIYNAQVQNASNAYDVDFNCALYSVSAMNALVQVLGFSKDSSLYARLFGQNSFDHVDTEEDRATYAQEIAKKMPEYFDFDIESQTWQSKAFQDRQYESIFRRWWLTRKFLKEFYSQYPLSLSTS